MRNASPATTFVAALLAVAIIGSSLVNLGWANPKLPDAQITFHSPQDGRGYTLSSLLLNFSVWSVNDYNNGTRQAWYSIDGGAKTPVSLACEVVGSVIGYPYSSFWGAADLPPLSHGPHNVVVSIEYDFGDFVLTRSRSVTFQVDTSMRKPSVPEFTVKLVEGPYDIPSSYLISPYTGQNITIPGTHIDKRAIVVTIKNQPFASYYDANSGSNMSFYYNVRAKLHSEENWTVQYNVEDVPARTDSEYTTLVYPMYDENANAYQIAIIGLVNGFPPDAQVDFQAKAMIGYVHRVSNPNFTSQLDMFPYVFTGEESRWSSTQTITIFGDIPNLSILTLQNASYSTSNVPLIFTIDKPVSQVEYSLDGQPNVTVAGNTTLTELANGFHNVTVYAADEAGKTGASETVFFKVEVPEPFPIMPIVVSVTVTAVVAVAVLVYLKKRKSSGLGVVKNP